MTAETSAPTSSGRRRCSPRLPPPAILLVITHGNGPQVGLLALQAATSPEPPFPLDMLDAESAGMIGYVLQQELGNAIKDRLFAALLSDFHGAYA